MKQMAMIRRVRRWGLLASLAGTVLLLVYEFGLSSGDGGDDAEA